MHGTDMPRPARATHRYAALLLAVLWSAAPPLSVAHVLVESHRYCGEHGVLEEAAQGGPGRPGGDGHSTAVGARQAAAAHEDCAFHDCWRTSQTLWRHVVEAHALPLIADAGLPQALTYGPALPILALAPKTSPPA